MHMHLHIPSNHPTPGNHPKTLVILSGAKDPCICSCTCICSSCYCFKKPCTVISTEAAHIVSCAVERPPHLAFLFAFVLVFAIADGLAVALTYPTPSNHPKTLVILSGAKDPCICSCICSCSHSYCFKKPKRRHLDRSSSHRELRSGDTPAPRLCICTCTCTFLLTTPLPATTLKPSSS
jgi:hypothetical protein